MKSAINIAKMVGLCVITAAASKAGGWIWEHILQHKADDLVEQVKNRKSKKRKAL